MVYVNQVIAVDNIIGVAALVPSSIAENLHVEEFPGLLTVITL